VSPNATATPPVPPPPSPQAKTPTPQKSPTNLKAIGLIPSTPPDQRRKEIIAGRNNPFALMGINVLVDPKAIPSDTSSGEPGKPGGNSPPTPDNGKPTIRVPPNQKPINGKPPIQGPSGKNPIPGVQVVSGAGKRPTVAFYPVGRYCKFEGKSEGAIIEIQPEEAQGILVSGIMKLPTATYAIVTPKNAKVAQYIRQGAWLGNGLVRVAAIDPANETVVFEENGKFVYREIGQRPVAVETQGAKLKGDSFPFKIKPPQGKQAYGVVVRGNRALMLTQANILMVNVAGEDKPGIFKQLASPPWTRNPNPNAPAPVAVPVPTQPTNPPGVNPPNPAGGTGTQGTNPPANPPQGTNGPAVTSQPAAPQKSIRLSGTICNDSSSRITVSRIKIQIQDAETNTVLDTQWNDVASTNVVLDRGQKAKFDIPIPRLQESSGTVLVRLLDWQGG